MRITDAPQQNKRINDIVLKMSYRLEGGRRMRMMMMMRKMMEKSREIQ